MDPSGRISEVEAGNMLLPAQCIMCGRGGYEGDEKFLDIKRDIDDFGSIYFCIECAQEVGFAAGCASPREFQAISLANEQLTEENALQGSMLERLGDGLERDILDYLSRRGITPVFSDGDHSASGTIDSSLVGGDQLLTDVDSSPEPAVSGTERTVDGPEPEPTESSTVEGPNDPVESTGSDDESDFLFSPTIEL